MSADHQNQATRQCPAFFVTGTDTGVGKTLVTAALAHYLTQRGLKVGVMKPVETGVANPKRLGGDAELLRWSCNSDERDEIISPYRFIPPVAPAQAVEAAKTHIDIDLIGELVSELRLKHDIVLIEGAGGLMVPIEGGVLMADFAARLKLPILLVTHPRLGTINHTLLTTYTARAMGLEQVGYIINQMPNQPDEVTANAPHLLGSLASADLLGVLPEVDGDPHHKISSLAAAIAEQPTLHWLLNALSLSLPVE